MVELSRLVTGGATRPDSISGLQPVFNQRLSSLFAAMPPELGGKMLIGSGYRSPETQAQIISKNAGKYGINRAAWEADVASMGAVAAGQKWRPQFKSSGMSANIGAPGGSNHQHGVAADLKYLSPKAGEWARANAGKFDLAFPMSHEPWHIEPIEARQKGSMAEAGIAPRGQLGDAVMTMPDGTNGTYQGPGLGGAMPSMLGAPSPAAFGDLLAQQAVAEASPAASFLKQQQALKAQEDEKASAEQVRRAALYDGVANLYG